jgi:hypothetical protein
VSQAIFGLLGVVVGAAVSGGVTLYLEWARERAVARGAARILQGDLANTEAQIDEALGRDLRWPGQFRLRTARWYEYQPIMARRLREYEWYAVDSAFDFLEGINQFDQWLRADKQDKRVPLDDQGRMQLELGRRLAQAGRAHLDRAAKWRSWLHRAPALGETTEVQEVLAALDPAFEEEAVNAGEMVDWRTGRRRRRKRH